MIQYVKLLDYGKHSLGKYIVSMSVLFSPTAVIPSTGLEKPHNQEIGLIALPFTTAGLKVKYFPLSGLGTLLPNNI